jgi:glycosyltransferase involved in cell wall biosynthesis
VSGYLFPFSIMMRDYLLAHGHDVTFDPSGAVDIALCVAAMPAPEAVDSLKRRGAQIVHRLDGRYRSIVKRYDADQEARQINALANWTVFQSEYVKIHTTTTVETLFGPEPPICRSPERSSIIYNGVNRTVFSDTGPRRPFPNKVNVLHVAITAGIRKGTSQVLEMAALVERNPDIHFHFVGNQDKDLVSGHIIAGNHLGNVSHVAPILDQFELASYIRSCQVLFFPSRNDYCPNTVIESMSCGLPILYDDSGGTRELITDGVVNAGVAILPENPLNSLATVIEHRTTLGRNAISLVNRRFTSDRIGAQYVELFEKLLSGEAAETSVN